MHVLLQIQNSDDIKWIIIYIALGALTIVLAVLLIHAILKIPAIAKEARAQTLLAAKTAEKAGVDIKEIEKILSDAHDKKTD